MEQQIKERKKKLTIDLWIIALVTIAVYIVYGVFGSRIMSFCKNSDISVWPRLLMVWGFFEGFNYVVICEKINRRFPVKTKFFDWGALVVSIMGILFHPMSFSIQGIIEIVTTFIAIYGMLQVRKVYKNAWGCVFAFLFIWNAL